MTSCIYMFITSSATKKQFASRKLLTQAYIQSYFWIINMETYKCKIISSDSLLLKENKIQGRDYGNDDR